ncbi:DUF58 domain-containing protein [Paraflavitalea pollutisoli]|uniref:DUF58 domain-containing protein n=1 Tax=Paraflavitalea pollutisoli TaxID=3034143 RepID=UPI0023EDE4EF|nr:DUF58 domain-containing protein [Paraflavitalea sp. H1-2-19X]
MALPTQHTIAEYPPEVVTTLPDLLRFEYLVQAGHLLPAHPVYSLLAGRHASKLRGRGLDFEEVRLYIPGDDIRNIDWHVTARTGKTHSKVFNEEKERPTFIVLDQTTSLFFGSQRYVKSVIGAHAAALGAYYTIKRGDRVGGIIFNESGADYIPPRRSKAAVEHFLQCVVNRNQQLPQRQSVQNNTPHLNKALHQVQASVTHDYVITVISDFSRIDDETQERLRSLSYHNDVILIHLYDPFEEALPDGKLVLSNGPHQLLWRNNRRQAEDTYSNQFKQWQQEITSAFRHTRIPIVFFTTAQPVEEQVRRSMGILLD